MTHSPSPRRQSDKAGPATKRVGRPPRGESLGRPFCIDWKDWPTETPFALRGSGGMAKAALRDAGFRDGTIVARDERTGRALAQSYGYAFGRDARPPARSS